MSSTVVAMITAAAASFTDAAAASATDSAYASYTDDAAYSSGFDSASYTDDGAATFTYDAAYRASTAEAFEPPAGVTPNYYGPNVNGTVYIVVTVIGLVLATTMTLIRLYTKAFIKRHLGWDDYTCALSLIGLFAWSGVTIRMAQLFLGVHLWNIITTVERKEYFYKLEFISNTVYPLVLCLIKVSILLLYLRTFKVCGRRFRITLNCVLILIVISHAVSIILDWLSVTPLKCQWMFYDAPEEVEEAICHVRFDQFPYFVFLGALTIALDILIIFLPLREVLQLRMVKRQKIALVMVFLAGIMVTIATVLRLGFVIRRFYFDSYFDDTFTEFQDDITSTIELDLALICASVPTIQTFLTHFVPGFLGLDSPNAPPRQANADNRFFNKPRRHALVSESLPSSSFSEDTEMQLQSPGSSVTANPEKQSQSRHERSLYGSYIEIGEDEKANPTPKITTHRINSPLSRTAHERY